MPGGFYKKSKFAYTRKGMRAPKFYSEKVCVSSKIFYPNLSTFLQVAFFDPGSTSCALRIVRYYIATKTMEVIWFSVLNFGNETALINSQMRDCFEPVIPYLEDCHHIMVEHQLIKKSAETTFQCFSAMVYVITTEICTKKMHPILIEVDCQLKTVFLDGPRTKRENNSEKMKNWVFEKTGKVAKNGEVEIKEWTKMMSREFSIEREDFVTFHILENSLYKPNEDLSDTVCYEYGWISYIMSREDIFVPYSRSLFE